MTVLVTSLHYLYNMNHCSILRSLLNYLQSTAQDCLFQCLGELAKFERDRRLLREKSSELREIIEVDDCLLRSLQRKKILSDKHVDELKKTLYSTADKLLDFLLYRYVGVYSKVMAALDETGQEHVVNFISLAGGMN